MWADADSDAEDPEIQTWHLSTTEVGFSPLGLLSAVFKNDFGICVQEFSTCEASTPPTLPSHQPFSGTALDITHGDVSCGRQPHCGHIGAANGLDLLQVLIEIFVHELHLKHKHFLELQALSTMSSEMMPLGE